jgi:hypothetical protein
MPEQQLQPNPDNYLVSANGRLGNPPQSAVGEVARILALAAQKAPENGLVLHFHGGLVDRKYALNNIAAPLTAVYGSANAYPLFFIWESGFKEAIWNNKGDLVKDPAFRELVKKVSEWVLKKVSVTGAFGFKGAGGQQISDTDKFREEFDRWFANQRSEPPSETTNVNLTPATATRAKANVDDLDELAEQIKDGFDDDKGFTDAMAQAFNASIPVDQVATKGVGTGKKRADVLMLSSNALDEMFPPQSGTGVAGGQVKTRGLFSWVAVAKFVAKIVIAVVRRFKADRDHGVYCTVVEEVLRTAYGDLIGAAIWNQMKKDTLDSFVDDPSTCGLAVVKGLKALESEDKGFKKLTLVGHSTGAVYICNFLDIAKKVELTTPIQVVFLAPAVTCERFAQAIDEHGEGGLQNFRMFAMKNEREIGDEMLKPLYTRSLLYFVSGLLEGEAVEGGWNAVLDMPLVGMQRFYEHAPIFGNDPSVKKVLDFLNAKVHRVVWSQTLNDGPGLNSDSARHGDFDNDKPTLDSIVAIIKG